MSVSPVFEKPSVATPTNQPARHLWTIEEYYRLADLGFFGDNPHVELIEGEIIDKVSPQRSRHNTSVYLVSETLARAFGRGFHVRSQSPLVISARSEPEPDAMVLVGSARDYVIRKQEATDARLVVEVSDTSLTYDRGEKAILYAKAGIPEYWVVNVQGAQVEVFRQPVQSGGYGVRTVHSVGESITPLHAPNTPVAVADLLP